VITLSICPWCVVAGFASQVAVQYRRLNKRIWHSLAFAFAFGDWELEGIFTVGVGAGTAAIVIMTVVTTFTVE